MGGHVHSVEARILDHRTGDPHVDLLRPGLTQHPHDSERRGSADYRVVHQNYPFVLDDAPDRRQFHLHTFVPHLLRRLDESPADVAVLDESHLVRKSASLGVTGGGAQAGVRNPDHDVRVHVRLPVEDLSALFPERMDVTAFDVAVRAGEVNIFHGAHRVTLVV